jgi:hypothetical protein
MEKKVHEHNQHIKPQKWRKGDKVPKYMMDSIRVGSSYFGTEVQTTNLSGDGWYRRVENNPWRPIVADTADAREALNADEMPWYDGQGDRPAGGYSPPGTSKSFHFSTIRRKQDVIAARKMKKREWYRRAYKMAATQSQYLAFEKAERQTGIAPGYHADWLGPAQQAQAQAKQKHSELFDDSLVSSYASLMDKKMGGGGTAEDDVDDDYSLLSPLPPHRPGPKAPNLPLHRPEVAEMLSEEKARELPVEDDLLKWSQALDFEEYSKSWLRTASSLGTEADVAAPDSIATSNFDVSSGGGSLYLSKRSSRK